MTYSKVLFWGLAAIFVMAGSATADGPSLGTGEEGAKSHVTAACARTGTIAGKISFAKKSRLRNKRKEFVKVVVSVEDIELADDELASARSSRDRPVIDQKDMSFRPHVLPVLVGEPVEFPNSDPLFHNVYSNDDVKRFDLGMYPKGQSKQIVFDKPGIVELRCKVHSEMQAFILIKKNPYFATVQRDGRFKIENVPIGSHTIEFWHPKAESITKEVTVEAGSTAELSVEFTKRRGRKG